jgi:hypothetical protein
MVEDPFICSYVRNVLSRRGYRLLQVDAVQGMELIEKRDPRVALVITNRPEEFLPFSDRVPVLYLAAFPDLRLASRFRACRALAKPFRAGQLVEAVQGLAGSL